MPDKHEKLKEGKSGVKPIKCLISKMPDSEITHIASANVMLILTGYILCNHLKHFH